MTAPIYHLLVSPPSSLLDTNYWLTRPGNNNISASDPLNLNIHTHSDFLIWNIMNENMNNAMRVNEFIWNNTTQNLSQSYFRHFSSRVEPANVKMVQLSGFQVPRLSRVQGVTEIVSTLPCFRFKDTFLWTPCISLQKRVEKSCHADRAEHSEAGEESEKCCWSRDRPCLVPPFFRYWCFHINSWSSLNWVSFMKFEIPII